MRSLSRRQVAHHSPCACVTTLRSWPAPRRHPCRTFARRRQPAPGRSDPFGSWEEAGRAAAAVTRSLHGLRRSRPRRRPTGPGRTPPFGASPRCPTPTAAGARARTRSNTWSAIRSEVGRPSKAERSSRPVIGSRGGGHDVPGDVLVLDPRLELGVGSGGVLGDLDPALPGEPVGPAPWSSPPGGPRSRRLRLTRGTRRPSAAPTQGDGLGIRCLRKRHSCSKCVVMSRALSSSR